jgi:hypothetical protein
VIPTVQVWPTGVAVLVEDFGERRLRRMGRIWFEVDAVQIERCDRELFGEGDIIH